LSFVVYLQAVVSRLHLSFVVYLQAVVSWLHLSFVVYLQAVVSRLHLSFVVYLQAVVSRLHLSETAAHCFYLFETVEYNFGKNIRHSMEPNIVKGKAMLSI
jgi:hypothetical protein